MQKDIKLELYPQPEEQKNEIVFEPLGEINPPLPFAERLKAWIEAVDH